MRSNIPKSIENSPVAEDANQAVFHCDVVQKGALGVWDEGVGDPEQRHQTSVHAHALIPREHQPGIPPALTEEDCCSVVLKAWRRWGVLFISSPALSSYYWHKKRRVVYHVDFRDGINAGDIKTHSNFHRTLCVKQRHGKARKWVSNNKFSQELTILTRRI